MSFIKRNNEDQEIRSQHKKEVKPILEQQEKQGESQKEDQEKLFKQILGQQEK